MNGMPARIENYAALYLSIVQCLPVEKSLRMITDFEDCTKRHRRYELKKDEKVRLSGT